MTTKDINDGITFEKQQACSHKFYRRAFHMLLRPQLLVADLHDIFTRYNPSFVPPVLDAYLLNAPLKSCVTGSLC